MAEKEVSFSLKDFKKWISQHGESDIAFVAENSLKPGDRVLVRLSEKNIISKLKPLNESNQSFKESCSLVKENGAIISKISGPIAEVKVLGSNNILRVPKLFLRRPTEPNKD